jgi:hypothetical protein
MRNDVEEIESGVFIVMYCACVIDIDSWVCKRDEEEDGKVWRNQRGQRVLCRECRQSRRPCCTTTNYFSMNKMERTAKKLMRMVK